MSGRMIENAKQYFAKRIIAVTFIKNINLFIALVLFVCGMLLTPSFLTLSNLSNILKQISVNGILACGFTFVLLAGGFDLSMGANVSLCACLLVGFQNAGMDMYIAILIVSIVGMGIGLFNAFVINLIKAELSDVFMVTLASSMLVFSLGLAYSKGFQMYINDLSFAEFGTGSVLSIIPMPFLILIIVAIISQIIIGGTRLGRKIYLVGGSKTASFLSGINVRGIKYFVFTVAGLSCAIAAVIITSRTSGANAYAARGYEFDAAIAAIIGGNELGGGKGGMGRTMIGVIILGLMANIMNIIGITSIVQMVVKGAILLISIYVDSLKKANMINRGVVQ